MFDITDVYSSLSMFGNTSNGNLDPFQSAISSTPDAGFTKYNGGWNSMDEYPRMLADVNGDRKADIVGFGYNSVIVSFGNGDGTFQKAISSNPDAGYTKYNGGWTSNDLFPRMLADVNGDGKADIVGFGGNSVMVSFSKGDGTFQKAISSFPDAGYTVLTGGWTSNSKLPRMLADINGDRKADIVGFGGNSVMVSLSKGDGTFQKAISSFPDAGYTVINGNWTNNDDFPRVLADVNGDRKADIVGFSGDLVFVSFGKGDGTFKNAIGTSPDVGFTKNKGGWTNNNDFPRILADVDGDRRADIVGFAGNSVFISLSKGDGTFQNAITSFPDVGYTKYNGGWTSNSDFPRMLADLNADGKADIVGFGHSLVDDWYSQNLKDRGVISITRALAMDGSLSRNDMIKIFRNTEDLGFISVDEIADLQTIVGNYTRFNIADYVRVLSNKIAIGSVANEYYMGGTLGNLHYYSSFTRMEALINKWFLGGDRPALPSGSNYSYQATGSLFGNDGIFSYQDIRQGALGDCYFLASLAATAYQRPSTIQNMFIDNGDGTFTVRFFGESYGKVTSASDYVTVDRYLPFGYAKYDSYNLGLWVALAEKAYAQFAESGLSQRKFTLNSYSSIEGGWGYWAMPSISGISGGYYTIGSPYYANTTGYLGQITGISQILTILSQGKAITASTFSADTQKITNNNLVANHEYTIIGADTVSNTLLLYNPWGLRISISYNDFLRSFYWMSVV